MTTINLDRINFVVEQWRGGPDGGPSIMIYDASPEGRQLLRFDCFTKAPHWHVDPGGKNVIEQIEADGSPVDWTLSELRGGLSSYLALAGFDAELKGEQDTVLDAVEDALRNPPAS